MTIQAPERTVVHSKPTPHVVDLRRQRIGPRLTSVLMVLLVVSLFVAGAVSLALIPVNEELAPAMELSWESPEALEISRTWVFDPAGESGFVLDPGIHPTLLPIASEMLRDVAALRYLVN